MYGTNQLQLKQDMRVLLCKNAKRVYVLVSHHKLPHVFPFVAILLLQTYRHYPSTTCFHKLSFAHLSISNDAENIRIIISHAPKIKCLNNRKNTVLTERNSFMPYQGMLARVSKINGKDVFDYFINIYADTVLADWLYHECRNSV